MATSQSPGPYDKLHIIPNYTTIVGHIHSHLPHTSWDVYNPTNDYFSKEDREIFLGPLPFDVYLITPNTRELLVYRYGENAPAIPLGTNLGDRFEYVRENFRGDKRTTEVVLIP